MVIVAGMLALRKRSVELYVAVGAPALAGTTVDDLVRTEDAAGRHRRQGIYLAIDRSKIRARGVEQLGKIVDHEVGLLEAVDAIAGTHDPAQNDRDAVGRAAFQAEIGRAACRERVGQYV